MNIHTMTIAATAIILTTVASGVAAQPGNHDNAGRTGQSQHSNKPGMHQSGDARMHGRDDAARRHDVGPSQSHRRGNENSNRQSDPGSTRGLERAAERRSENADRHQGQAEKESHWYDSMFGRSKKSEGDVESGYGSTEKKQRWWWPFD